MDGALFDRAEYEGNNHGQIDGRDTVLFNLKLGQDRNHNGVPKRKSCKSWLAQRFALSNFAIRSRSDETNTETGSGIEQRYGMRGGRKSDVGRGMCS